jgi:hypothetical protein
LSVEGWGVRRPDPLGILDGDVDRCDSVWQQLTRGQSWSKRSTELFPVAERTVIQAFGSQSNETRSCTIHEREYESDRKGSREGRFARICYTEDGPVPGGQSRSVGNGIYESPGGNLRGYGYCSPGFTRCRPLKV